MTTPPSRTPRRRRRAAALATAVLLPLTSVVGLTSAAAAPAPRLAADVRALLPGNAPDDDVVLFSTTGAGDGAAAEDVLRLDRRSGARTLVVDGSDLGLTGGLDALVALSDGSLLLSADRAFTAPDLGPVEPEDVLRFTPSQLGEATAGTLAWFLDGSDVGLDSPVADVDALAVSPDGRLLVSPGTPLQLGRLLAKPSDLVALSGAVYGADSAGTWEPYLVGADLGLRSRNDDVDGASVNAATGGSVFLSTAGRTTPPAVPADVDQVLRCEPTSLAPRPTACALALFEDLDVAIDAVHVGTAAWLDPGCEAPSFDVDVTSHADGELVDTGEQGTGTGSFVLRGRAPVAATAVTVTVAGESARAEVADTGCGVTWTREVVGLRDGPASFTVTSTGPTGVHEDTVELRLRAPGDDDVLVQPAFADTPQHADRLVSYDPATGDLVFRGDVTADLRPGSGLGGGQSAAAPNGYLRIVLTAASDGATTRVTTRQAGLTELVRQIDVDHSVRPGDVEPLVFSTRGPAAPQARSSSPDPSARSLVPLGEDTDVVIDFELDPGVDFDLDVVLERGCFLCLPLPSVERLWFEGSMELTAQLEVEHRLGGITTGEQPFGPRFDDFRLGGLTIPTPIGVPIVLTFEAESQAFYELSLSAVVKFELGASMTFTAGFEYEEDGGGRGAYRDAFHGVEGPSITEVDAGLVAKATAGLEVDFEVLLYGLNGVELEARPQLELEFIGDVVDRDVSWELELVVPVDGNLEVEIRLGPVDWEREFGDLDFVTFSVLLAEGTLIGGDDDGDGDDGESGTALTARLVAPPGAFPGQAFDLLVRVRNGTPRTATGVVVRLELPDEGSFVSSSPTGSPADPQPGSTYAVELPDVAAGATTTATVRWRAPKPGQVVLRASATVRADGVPTTTPSVAEVPVGLEGACNPCGATAAGTGLRNRAEGTIEITGVPAGATVTRAVLHWGILYSGTPPRDTITLAGQSVQADVAATVSGDLCWGDRETIGYTADVTSLVTGNGSYLVTDPPRGTTRPDAEPRGVLPYTDGASLVVFYVGGGASSQVLSDFTYSTSTAGAISRTFEGRQQPRARPRRSRWPDRTGRTTPARPSR